MIPNKELSLSRNMIWNSVGSFTYLICQWLLTLIVVRVSPNMDNVGNLSLSISITNIFYNLACFNVRPYLVSDTTGKFKVCEYSAFRIFTAISAMILCIFYVNIFNYTWQQKVCIVVYMIFKLGETWVDLLHGLEQKDNRMDIGGISLLIRGLLSVASFTLCLLFTDNIIYSILGMIIVTWGFIYFYDMRMVKFFSLISPQITRQKLFRLLIEFLPITVGSLMSAFATTYPRQILESYMGTEALGIYATVATPAVIIQVAASYVFNPLLTIFAKYYYEKRYHDFSQLILKTCGLLLLISGIAIIGFMGLGEWGLNLLYGDKVASYSFLLLPVIIFTSLNAFVWFLWNVLVVLRKLKSLLIINLISLIFLFSIVRPMIKEFEMNGVSYTLILFSVVLLVEMTIILVRLLINNAPVKR